MTIHELQRARALAFPALHTADRPLPLANAWDATSMIGAGTPTRDDLAGQPDALGAGASLLKDLAA